MVLVHNCAVSLLHITDIAAQENRDLSDEDVIKFNGLKSRIEATSAAIDRESALISEEAQMGTGLHNVVDGASLMGVQFINAAEVNVQAVERRSLCRERFKL